MNIPIINNINLLKPCTLKKCKIINQEHEIDICWIPKQYCIPNFLIKFEFDSCVWKIEKVYDIEIDSVWLMGL